MHQRNAERVGEVPQTIGRLTRLLVRNPDRTPLLADEFGQGLAEPELLGGRRYDKFRDELAGLVLDLGLDEIVARAGNPEDSQRGATAWAETTTSMASLSGWPVAVSREAPPMEPPMNLDSAQLKIESTFMTFTPPSCI